MKDKIRDLAAEALGYINQKLAPPPAPTKRLKFSKYKPHQGQREMERRVRQRKGALYWTDL